MASIRKTLEVAVKSRPQLELPKIRLSVGSLPKLIKDLPSFERTGFYYGIPPGSLKHAKQPARMDMRDTVTETLSELRSMRHEMELLRKEMHQMKRQLGGSGDGGETDEDDNVDQPQLSLVSRHKRQRNFEKIGTEVERWAEELLFQQDGVEDGWSEVTPNKVLGFNRDGRTKAYVKWMKDSRGKHADPDDKRSYPCLKMYTTIDAPLQDVCLYLSQKEHMDDYNELSDTGGDLEDVTPHSKISWTKAPQILFLKPRLFTTYCSHRWLRDGTQVVVNQACEHPDTPGQDKLPTAYAIRGANYISRDPDDPEKTRIAMLSHGNPGRDVPGWAVKTAVNTLLPIEPFKLFYKLNKGVARRRPELERRLEEIEMVSAPPGRTARPAGLAQLGYACFWPHGGGVEEGIMHRPRPEHSGEPEPTQGEPFEVEVNEMEDTQEQPADVDDYEEVTEEADYEYEEATEQAEAVPTL